MAWTVKIADEFDRLPEEVQLEVLALSRLLQEFWPATGAPRCGHAEELPPLEYEGTAVQRRRRRMAVASAFDTKRAAILLAAGDKSGVGQKRFYRELIRKADERFDAHLERIEWK